MKLILLAASAALAVPGLVQAQMTPTPPADPAQTTPPPADPSTAPQPGMAPMGTPAGGYQPSAPAMQGTMQPGVQPVYQPAPSPSQAYPAPAPKDSYPVCKKGQYDGCVERGSRK